MARKIKDYTDIGHGTPGTMIWIFREGRCWAVRGGTHEFTWGVQAMKFWRGQYEPIAKLLSVVAPACCMAAGRHVPYPILQAIEERFGKDVKIYEFNLQARRVRRRGKKK